MEKEAVFTNLLRKWMIGTDIVEYRRVDRNPGVTFFKHGVCRANTTLSHTKFDDQNSWYYNLQLMKEKYGSTKLNSYKTLDNAAKKSISRRKSKQKGEHFMR